MTGTITSERRGGSFPPRRFRLALLAALLVVAFSPRVQAQIPGLPLPGAPEAPAASAPAAAKKPARADVTLAGRDLFSVTADAPGQARDRADLVSLRLNKALAESMPMEEPPPVTVRTAGADTVLHLGDQPLLTVTRGDADAENKTVTQLANAWAVTIEGALEAALRERRPGFWREAAVDAGWILGIAVLIHLAVWLLARRFFDHPGWPVLVLVWLSAANRIAFLFPQTRPLHNAVREGVLRPLWIVLLVALAAAALSRLLGAVLRRVFPPLPDHLSPEERTERNLRRRATLGTVARVTGASVIWTVAVVVALSWSGVNLPALLTSAGLIGVAVGFAAQDSLKDLVAGVNILVDDRFGVGDVIRVGEHEGTVEKLNLRVTQIRDLSGRVITFPNRVIETVVNSTLRWAQVDFQVDVAYETDLRAAMQVLENTAQALQDDWPERILAPPEMLGVDSFNASDITLRMLVRTLPGDQWAVGRELRLRVKDAFDDAGVTIAFPQLDVRVA